MSVHKDTSFCRCIQFGCSSFHSSVQFAVVDDHFIHGTGLSRFQLPLFHLVDYLEIQKAACDVFVGIFLCC